MIKTDATRHKVLEFRGFLTIKISEQLPISKITIVTKMPEGQTNIKYIRQLAVVMDFDTDNFQKHIDDTMRAGDYENNH